MRLVPSGFKSSLRNWQVLVRGPEGPSQSERPKQIHSHTQGSDSTEPWSSLKQKLCVLKTIKSWFKLKPVKCASQLTKQEEIKAWIIIFNAGLTPTLFWKVKKNKTQKIKKNNDLNCPLSGIVKTTSRSSCLIRYPPVNVLLDYSIGVMLSGAAVKEIYYSLICFLVHHNVYVLYDIIFLYMS